MDRIIAAMSREVGLLRQRPWDFINLTGMPKLYEEWTSVNTVAAKQQPPPSAGGWVIQGGRQGVSSKSGGSVGLLSSKESFNQAWNALRERFRKNGFYLADETITGTPFRFVRLYAQYPGTTKIRGCTCPRELCADRTLLSLFPFNPLQQSLPSQQPTVSPPVRQQPKINKTQNNNTKMATVDKCEDWPNCKHWACDLDSDNE